MNSAEQLAAGVVRLGLELPVGAQEKLLRYLELLEKWNRIYNLTAVRDPMDRVTHHLLDSLAILPYLNDAADIADVGSGAGLPGLVLAIARPTLRLTSIEANRKKCAFQTQVKIELEVENVVVQCGRVESLPSAPAFDAVISRAFASLADFVALAGPLARSSGRLLAMKGVLSEAEMAALPPNWHVAATHRLEVPGLAAQRHLIVVERG